VGINKSTAGLNTLRISRDLKSLVGTGDPRSPAKNALKPLFLAGLLVILRANVIRNPRHLYDNDDGF